MTAAELVVSIKFKLVSHYSMCEMSFNSLLSAVCVALTGTVPFVIWYMMRLLNREHMTPFTLICVYLIIFVLIVIGR